MSLSSEDFQRLVNEIRSDVKQQAIKEKSVKNLKRVKLIAGRSNPELADKIAQYLNMPLVKVKYTDFANTETYVQLEQNVRGSNVYILQTGGTYENHSINDHVMELYQLIDACKLSSAKSISVILPTYPYARSDKKESGRTSIMGSFIARQLTNLGVTRIIGMHLHNPAIQGFTNISFDNLPTIKLLSAHLLNTLFKGMTKEEINSKYVLCAPDAGAIKNLEKFAQRLGMNHVIMHKHRDYTKSSVVLNSQLIGDPELIKGKIVIIVDDLMDTMGTMVSAGEELKNYGIVSMIVIATHGVFSNPAMERINKSDIITKVIVTNTLPQKYNLEKTNKLEVVDAGPLIGEVIRRIQCRESVSELFN